jgi:Mn2+/Fe2+ NRAMP family transporter
MQGGSSIRGSNSSGACFSRHCGDPFIAVALKKRRRHALFCFSTAYVVSEGLDLEAGVSKSFREAPVFHGLYLEIIVIGALVIMIPNAPLLSILYLSQVVNGVLLPIVLIFMLVIINEKSVMGEHVYSRICNYIT